MKTYPLTLICLLGIAATADATANELKLMATATTLHPTLVGSATQSIVAPAKGVGFDSATRRVSGVYVSGIYQSDLSVRGNDATTLPLPSVALAASGLDKWLMLLAAVGLVVLQLRRKHKSLPQRPMVDGGNGGTSGANGPIMYG